MTATMRRRFDPGPLMDDVEGQSDSEAADTLGVSRRTINAWRNRTRQLTPAQAERLAVRRGVHVSNFWPEWWDR